MFRRLKLKNIALPCIIIFSGMVGIISESYGMGEGPPPDRNPHLSGPAVVANITIVDDGFGTSTVTVTGRCGSQPFIKAIPNFPITTSSIPDAGTLESVVIFPEIMPNECPSVGEPVINTVSQFNNDGAGTVTANVVILYLVTNG